MRRALFMVAITIALLNNSYGQGEIDDQQRIFYRHERTFAPFLQTDGFGISYREGRRIDARNKTIYDIDLGMFRHPREIRLTNPYYQSGSTFVFGKLNTPLYLRGGIGKQRELYTKEYKGGISVRYFYSGGVSISINKPIYYKVLYPVSNIRFTIVEEKFHESIHWPGDIFSSSSFFKGIKETSFIPGVYGKGGFNFEYSPDDRVIHALELGVSVNAYPKKVPIMATEDNRAIKAALFFSYRVGIVIDPLDPRSNRITTIFLRNR